MKIKTFEEKREGTQQVDQNTRIFFYHSILQAN